MRPLLSFRSLGVGSATSSRPSPSNFNVELAFVSASLLSHQYPKRLCSKRYQHSTSWIPHPFKATSASVNVPASTGKRNGEKKIAYIALGSNLGDKIGWIQKACDQMSSKGIDVKRTSLLWETTPMYVLDQDTFVNGACEVETTLDPIGLLDALQSIENELGRKKIIDKGPRNIDLDILLYNDEVIDHPRLQIPHVGILEREFVLRPLSELIPGKAILPSSPWKVTQDYLNSLPQSGTPFGTATPLAFGMEPIRALDPGRKTITMAILNITPDSFSDGGVLARLDSTSLREEVEARLKAGATIIDIGGESTRPGASPISPDEELSRVLPIVKMLKTEFRGRAAISIDTYHASVAEAAVIAGADLVNDVSAGTLDPKMLPTMATLGKPVCLMHMRGTPATMNSPEYTSYPEGLIHTVARELLLRVAAAEAAGIRKWNIILDPGIGFAKTLEQNLELLRRLDELRNWPGLVGMPWLLGTSRKGFIKRITGEEPPRLFGTAATVAASVFGGADIIRVHDVKEMVDVARMSDAIWRI